MLFIMLRKNNVIFGGKYESKYYRVDKNWVSTSYQ